MRLRVLKSFDLVLMAMFGASFASCTHFGSMTTDEIPDFDVEKAIQSARTPEDHKRIAAYYERAAVEYQQKAAYHERMGNAYLHYSGPRNDPTRDMTEYSVHCENLTRMFNRTAEEYRSLARGHRSLAD